MNEPRRMKTAKWLWAALALGVAAFFVLTWDDDARKIAKQLDRLQGLIEKEAGESQLVGANKARQLGDLFTRQFEIAVDVVGASFTDRGRMAQSAMGYRMRSERIGFGWRQASLEIDKTRRVAEQELTATVTGDELRREGYRLLISWAEEDGEWKIARLRVVEQLEGMVF